MRNRFHGESNGDRDYYSPDEYQFSQFTVKKDSALTPAQNKPIVTTTPPKKALISVAKTLPPIDEKDYEYNAEQAHYWADWVASVFGDMADIAFGLQPLFTSPVLRLIPLVGLTPIILGFGFKWMLYLLDLKKEEVPANRYINLITTLGLIGLTFITFVISLPAPVMMGVLGASIIIESMYSTWNLANAVLKYLKNYGSNGEEQKQLTTLENDFYKSLSRAQCAFLRKKPENIKLLAESSAAELTNNKHFKALFNFNNAHQKVYRALHNTTMQTPEKAAQKLLLTNEQAALYYAIVAMRRHKREYQHEIADRSHILGYGCLALVGAVLVAIPATLPIGCIILVTAGVWGFLDKVNINTNWIKERLPFLAPICNQLAAWNIHTVCLHPFKLVVNKLFDNILSAPQPKFVPERSKIDAQQKDLRAKGKANAVTTSVTTATLDKTVELKTLNAVTKPTIEETPAPSSRNTIGLSNC